MQNDDASKTEAAALMQPAGEDVLQAWLVSQRVNSSRTSDEDATLIEAISFNREM